MSVGVVTWQIIYVSIVWGSLSVMDNMSFSLIAKKIENGETVLPKEWYAASQSAMELVQNEQQFTKLMDTYTRLRKLYKEKNMR